MGIVHERKGTGTASLHALKSLSEIAERAVYRIVDEIAEIISPEVEMLSCPEKGPLVRAEVIFAMPPGPGMNHRSPRLSELFSRTVIVHSEHYVPEAREFAELMQKRRTDHSMWIIGRKNEKPSHHCLYILIITSAKLPGIGFRDEADLYSVFWKTADDVILSKTA